MKIYKLLPITLLILCKSGFSQVDSLNSVYSFSSPSLNDWGLAYDGANFWISDTENGNVYHTTGEGVVLDSIHFNGAQLKGIAIENDTLWVLNSNVTGDTIIEGSTFPYYSLYKADITNKTVLDSIKVVGVYTNSGSGDLWGLCLFEGNFYISFNGGYGPCIIRFNKATHFQMPLCCTHLSGMTTIKDSIWAIGNGRAVVTTDGYDSFYRYYSRIYASDLAYDGDSFWVVDMNSNNIHQLSPVYVSINETANKGEDLSIFPNPASGNVSLTMNAQLIFKYDILDMNGQRITSKQLLNKTDYLTVDISALPAGVYILSAQTDKGVYCKKLMKK